MTFHRNPRYGTLDLIVLKTLEGRSTAIGLRGGLTRWRRDRSNSTGERRIPSEWRRERKLAPRPVLHYAAGAEATGAEEQSWSRTVFRTLPMRDPQRLFQVLLLHNGKPEGPYS